MTDQDGAPSARDGGMERPQHRHHDHHDGKYAWSGEDAEAFLRRMRRGARRAYAPMVLLVTSSLPRGAVAPVVLDVGCGPGLLLVELRRALPRARLVGVDPSKDMLALARRVASETGGGAPSFEALEGGAEALPVEDATVDVLACRRVLHEFDDAEVAFGEFARVMAPGGALVLQDFDGGYPRWRLRVIAGLTRAFLGRDAAERVTRPFEDAMSLKEVVGLCEGAGLKVVRVERRGRHLTLVARRPGP